MYSDKEVINGLQGLLEKNIDAEKGYRNAMESTKNTNLTTFFNTKAQQRNQFTEQLKGEINKLGGKHEGVSGSVAGALHRTWMDVKTALSTDNEDAVLEVCQTGEKAAIDEYDLFIGSTKMPSSTAQLVLTQRNGIAESLDGVELIDMAFDNKK